MARPDQIRALPERPPEVGELVQVRSRRWLVEEVTPSETPGRSPLVTLACADDDAQGQALRVFWDYEIDRRILEEEGWGHLAEKGFDDPRRFAAFLHTLRWHCVTATDSNLFQAPFRAGIRIDAYQMEPLRKALRLPRVNLFIADDTGLGKTIEAGLIARELLLRRKAKTIVVAAPPSVLEQWKGELEDRFGLVFEILDRAYLTRMRRERGFGVNPWMTHSRFLVSHNLLIDPGYADPMRAWLGPLRPGSLLILDEAHHAAPSSGGRYGIESKFTRAVRDLAGRFEHRLFLSATPHNGHSNSFSTLLELLDPYRFTRGVKVRGRKALEDVMVRRLKEDIRVTQGGFPERRVERVVIDGLPADAPELALSRLLDEYRTAREARHANASGKAQAAAGLLVVGLQQRLALVGRGVRAQPGRAPPDGRAPLGAGTGRGRHRRRARCDRGDGAATRIGGRGGVPGRRGPALPHAAHRRRRARRAGRRARRGRGRGPDRGDHPGRRVRRGPRSRRGTGGAVAARAGAARPHAGRRRAGPPRAGREDPPAHRLDARGDVPGAAAVRPVAARPPAPLERAPGPHLHREPRGDEALPPGHPGAGHRADGPRRRAHRGDRRADPGRPPQGDPAPVQRRPRRRPAAHPARHRRGPRGAELPGPLRRPLPLRPAVEPRPHRAAQRPHRPQAAAGAGGALPLLRAAAAGRGRGAGGAGAQDRHHQARAGQPVEGDRRRRRAAAARRHPPPGRRPAEARDRGGRPRRGPPAYHRGGAGGGARPPGRPRRAGRAVPRPARAVAKLGRVRGRAVPRRAVLRPRAARRRAPGARRRRQRRRPGAGDVDLPGPRPADRRGPDVGGDPRHPPAPAPARPEAGRLAPRGPHPARRLRGRRRARRRHRPPAPRAAGGPASARPVPGPGFRPPRPVAGLLRPGPRLDSPRRPPRPALPYGRRAERLHEEIVPLAARWVEPGRRSGPLRAYAREAETRTLDLLEQSLAGRPDRTPHDVIRARLLAAAPRDIEELLPQLEPRADEIGELATRRLRERGEREARDIDETLRRQRERIVEELDRHEGRFTQIALDFDEDERRQLQSNMRYWRTRLDQFDRDLKQEPGRIRAFYEVQAKRVEPVGLVYLWPETN